MKKKYLAVFMMATALTLTACGAKDTAEDSQQAEEQVTDTADETTAEASQDTVDTENGETAENNENMITELTANTAAEISGKEFTLKTERAYSDDDEIIAVTAVYGDQELKLDESLYVNGVYEVSLDGQEYVMTETTTFDDYGMIYLVKLDESGVTLVSTQDGHLREVPADPTEGFEIESKVDVLGTYGGIRTYFIQDDKLTANDTIYEFAGDPSGELPKLTVKGSIRCRLEGGNTTLEAGDVIIPQAYSPDDGTFYFELPDGTAGNLLVDLSPDGSEGQMTYSGTIGGVDENELFENLPYAG